jgi:hypothetical protein
MDLRRWKRGGLRHAERTMLRLSRPLRGAWPRPGDAMLGLLALLVVAFAISTYSTELARATSHLFTGNKYTALLNGLFNPFRTQHLLLRSGLPIYDLHITKREYSKIERTVEEAKQRGWMEDELKVWANARFFYDGREYDVKVRVRGDLSPHWEGPKKSWRIKFGRRSVEYQGRVTREADWFEGRHQINLIIPQDRDYILSYFLNSILRDQGLVVPRDRFVVLRINGAVQGLYYEVEHFDNALLAHYRRPETTVYAQNDRAMHFEQYTRYGTPAASDARFDVGSLRPLVDEEGQLGLRAMQVLIDHSLHPTAENFRRARAVLDWEKYLRFRVITTLCNTNHVRFGSDNLRLYYDPSRGLLEPIPWDVHVTRMPREPGTIDFWNQHGPDELQVATLLDPQLRLQRNRMLWELVSDDGRDLLARYDAIHKELRPLAWADVLTTPIQGHKMDERRADLAFNVHRIHKVLSLSSANLSYRLDADDRATLDFTATNFSGVRFEALEVSDPELLAGRYQLFADGNGDGVLDDTDPLVAEAEGRDGTVRLEVEKDVLPRLHYDGDEIEGRIWEYFDTLAGRERFFLVGRLAPERHDPLSWQRPGIRVTASNAVSGLPMPSASLDPDAPLPPDSLAIVAFDGRAPFDLDAPELGLDEFLAAHPEFRRSTTLPGGAELAGEVRLGDTVIVPRSVPLVLAPGADVALAPGVSLLAYGGFLAPGTPNEPIRVHEAVPGEPWGVIGVVRPPRDVVARHLEVRGGSQAQLNGILFTGGFAVHDGNLELEHCRFVGMQSEDGVNLKNGRIRMRDCLIAGGASDGMDLDFVTGEVRDSVFLANAGDGLDLSGSRLVVAGNRFEGMGDKGISVGEDSEPIVVNNLIRGNGIGLSTKDLSFARVAWSTFVDNGLAVEAKRKKPMFGGAGGEFVNNVYAGNRKLLSEDWFSQGRVEMRSSLFDADALACEGCRAGSVRFASDESGDFRLVSVGGGGDGVTPVSRPWARVEDEINGHVPATPGLFRVPERPNWRDEAGFDVAGDG